MDKHKFDFSTDWYELWMKQSKEFFETAEKNFKGSIDQGSFPNPDEHMKQIQQWLDALKNQWQFVSLNEHQKVYEQYWKNMAKMCNDASLLMLEQWKKRTHEQKPIKDIYELYDLWLASCHEIYENAMRTKSYQEAYAEFMKAALKFWKSAAPK
jgi:hypothetical protein